MFKGTSTTCRGKVGVYVFLSYCIVYMFTNSPCLSLHAHWCLSVSVHVPDTSLSCCAVLFLLLVSLSATTKRPC